MQWGQSCLLSSIFLASAALGSGVSDAFAQTAIVANPTVTNSWHIDTFDIPSYAHKTPDGYGSVYNDIIKHSKRGRWHLQPRHRSVVDADEINLPSTIGHETVHHICEDISRLYTGDDMDTIYLGSGRGAVVKNPKGVQLHHVDRYVPSKLKSLPAAIRQHLSYDTYFTRPIGENRGFAQKALYPPSYILYEANGTMFDGRIALHIHDTDPFLKRLSNENKGKGLTQSCGEFVLYTLALGAAIDARPTAYDTHKDKRQMMAAIKLVVENLADPYKDGMDKEKYPTFSVGLTGFLKLLAVDPSAAPLRDFAARTYGKDWLNNVTDLNHRFGEPLAPAEHKSPKAFKLQ